MKHRRILVPLAALALAAGCSSSEPAPEPTSSPESTASSKTTPATATTPDDEPSVSSMAQEAIDAYRDFHDALNEFAQDGFPAERQGELRLHTSGDYADRMIPNWNNGRKYGLSQSGDAVLESVEVISTSPQEKSVKLSICEDLTNYEYVGPEGQALDGADTADYMRSAVSMMLDEDRFQGDDYWVVTSFDSNETESC